MPASLAVGASVCWPVAGTRERRLRGGLWMQAGECPHQDWPSPQPCLSTGSEPASRMSLLTPRTAECGLTPRGHNSQGFLNPSVASGVVAPVVPSPFSTALTSSYRDTDDRRRPTCSAASRGRARLSVPCLDASATFFCPQEARAHCGPRWSGPGPGAGPPSCLASSLMLRVDNYSSIQRDFTLEATLLDSLYE